MDSRGPVSGRHGRAGRGGDGLSCRHEAVQDDEVSYKIGGATSAAFLFGRFSVNPRLTLLADLPIAHGSMDFTVLGVSERVSATVVGNPLIGARLQTPAHGLSLAASVRLPLADVSDDADALTYVAAMVADFDRMEAFAPDVIPIGLKGDYAPYLASFPPCLLVPDDLRSRPD